MITFSQFMNALSDAQKKSIASWKLDVYKIMNLPKQFYKPDTSNLSPWAPGNNFKKSILVGYRIDTPEDSNDPVYLKTDGWFTTAKDITNCNPFLLSDEPVFDDNLGYEFKDMTREGLQRFTGIRIGGKRKRRSKSNTKTKNRSKSNTKTKNRSKSNTKTKRRYRK